MKNETLECSRDALSASEGAKGQRMATAAESLYDKCPHALRQAMDTLDHNKEAQGYRCNLPQVYADIQACRDLPLLSVFCLKPAQAGAATLSGN